jgi:hypothetical protein
MSRYRLGQSHAFCGEASSSLWPAAEALQRAVHLQNPQKCAPTLSPVGKGEILTHATAGNFENMSEVRHLSWCRCRADEPLRSVGG